MGMMAAAAVVLTGDRADATLQPPGCNANDLSYKVSKNHHNVTVATTFRLALAAESCAFIQSISTPSQIVNGVPVDAVPPGPLPSTTVNGVPADIVDMGPLASGNHQIHPSTSATCNQ